MDPNLPNVNGLGQVSHRFDVKAPISVHSRIRFGGYRRDVEKALCMAPFCQDFDDLQRLQIRSPLHSLGNGVRHFRQRRVLEASSVLRSSGTT